jgi:hypothetical protein
MAIIVPITTTFNPKGLDQAIAAVKAAEGGFNKLNTTAGILSASLANTGRSLTRNVTVPLIGLGVVVNKTITDASNLAEAESKVTAVFGAQAQQIFKWGKTTSTALGVSSRAALEAAGTYGNLFQAFGIGRTESAKMSMKLVELAADMASFNNVPIGDALTALRSGLSGETEPLKRFGVALNDVRLRQEALNLGIYDGSGVLTVAQKSQAAYALILRDTALQQGDVARTAGGLANQKKFLAAQVEDLSGTFGAVLMPVMINVVGIIRNQVLPNLQKFIEAFKTLSPNAIVTGLQIALFAAALGPAMIAVGYLIKLVMGLAAAFQFLTKRIVLIPLALLYIVASLVKASDASMSWGDAVFKVVRGVVIAFVQVGNAVSFAINLLIKGYNKFQDILDSGVTIQEVGNLDFLIKGVDNARVAYGNFSSKLKEEQGNLSGLAAEANALAQSIDAPGNQSVGGASKEATEKVSAFTKALSAANQVLTDAQQKFRDYASSVTGSITGVIDFSSAASSETGSFLENLIAQATKAQDFGTKVRSLLSMGLSESAIGQVLAAGADVGTKIADEIIAGGATVVDQVNTLITATQSVAEEVGISAATQFYQAGVTAGQALVDGIRAAITAAGFSIDGDGNIVNPLAGAGGSVGVSAAIAAAPSGLSGGVGGGGKSTKTTAGGSIFTNQGLLNKLARIPKMAAGGIVSKPTLAMIGEAGPEAVVPLSGRNAGMGNVYNINVNAGMGTNGAQVGKEIVDAIKRFEKTSGPVFASA